MPAACDLSPAIPACDHCGLPCALNLIHDEVGGRALDFCCHGCQGAYLIITDRSSNSWGGPYELLRLESNEWVMARPGTIYGGYVIVK